MKFTLVEREGQTSYIAIGENKTPIVEIVGHPKDTHNCLRIYPCEIKVEDFLELNNLFYDYFESLKQEK